MSCENPSSDADALMPRRLKYDKSKICVKCKEKTGNIVIRHAVYCRDCFVPLIVFRFRRALEPHVNAKADGPRRTALKPTGNLLVALSGGLGSTVLLDLVNKCYANPDESFIPLDGGKDHPRHERVWKKITVCYVEVCDAFPKMKDRTNEMREVVASCEGVDFLPLRIQHAFDPSWWRKVGVHPAVSSVRVNLGDDNLPFTFVSGETTEIDPLSAVRQYLASLPTATALDATVKTIIRVLLQYGALLTDSSHILMGTTLTSIAVSLISSVSHGGGFHIKEEVQEEWFPKSSVTGANTSRESPITKARAARSVRMIRPLREIGRKECAVWSWWMGLNIVGREEWQWPGTKPGIGRLTRDFIFGLEKDYPSTVSTIVKTCAKLAPKGEKSGDCVICQRPIQSGVENWKNRIAIRSRDHDDPQQATDVRHLSRYLCYVCHTNLTSKGARPMPPLHTHDARISTITPPVWTEGRLDDLFIAVANGEPSPAVARMTEENMREAVKDFLLED